MKDNEKTKEKLIKELKELKKNNQKLSKELSLRSMLYSIDDLVFVLSNKGVFLNYYQGSQKVDLYITPDKFINKHFKEVLPRKVSKIFHDALNNLYSTGNVQEVEYALKIDDENKWFSAKLSPYKDPISGSTEIVLVVRNITKRKRMEESVNYLALHDTITGLPNRRLLLDRLNNAIKYAHRIKAKFGVIMIDLNDFKKVNDNSGHAAGDYILKTFAHRLIKTVRKSDTVARFGGDEFVILLPDIKNRELLTSFITKLKRSIPIKYNYGDSELQCAMSIGLAVYPDDGDTIDLLIKKSDFEMYEDKRKQL